MKIWKRYINYLNNGEWHIHTNYTDGNNSIVEYCQKATEKGIPLLAFTEHVRKELGYDFNAFLDEIEKAREEFDLIILSGCEAKVLPNGELDVERWILKEVDYPIFAFHSFPKDIDLYISCLKEILMNGHINTWAHPGVFLAKYGLKLAENDEIEIFKLMRKHDVLFEINRKYKVISNTWLDLAEKYGVNKVNGNDIHSLDDF